MTYVVASATLAETERALCAVYAASERADSLGDVPTRAVVPVTGEVVYRITARQGRTRSPVAAAS